MSSPLDTVLASIDQVEALSPDDFYRVIEHWKRRAAILWAGPALPMRGPAPPMQVSSFAALECFVRAFFHPIERERKIIFPLSYPFSSSPPSPNKAVKRN